VNISRDERNGIAVLRFEGNLDTGTAPDAEEALNSLLAGGTSKIVLDFTSLDYISSAGLRVLLASARTLRGGGGDLRLFGLNETVSDVFEISGFSTILAVFDAEDEALQDF
jgi:anti-anti-sigma factor